MNKWNENTPLKCKKCQSTGLYMTYNQLEKEIPEILCYNCYEKVLDIQYYEFNFAYISCDKCFNDDSKVLKITRLHHFNCFNDKNCRVKKIKDMRKKVKYEVMNINHSKSAIKTYKKSIKEKNNDMDWIKYIKEEEKHIKNKEEYILWIKKTWDKEYWEGILD